ncbi:uncharacterized protein LOC112054426 isoform X1 [Bicyclus anynana]|uniref:Uncharacterized protein LOC112054426 isoform X1 n=1 Tax=Bicyclus anynana TaxID=110368 RepID=A0A6J1NTA8_BICAN|nr:uncharacterized protein LOC112054426 isoform X1 [Bicyclus anynana]
MSSAVWDWYKRDSIELTTNGRRVQCLICDEKVDFETNADLKVHLVKHHPECLRDTSNKTGERRNRVNKSVMWNHFYDTGCDYLAECNYCKRMFSYKSTTTNLKRHLDRAHPLFSQLVTNTTNKSAVKNEGDSDDTGTEDENNVKDDDTAEQPQQSESSDAWKLFEKITTNRSAQNASSDSDNENYYTEVVYLEDDQPGGGVSNAKIIKPLKRKPELRVKKENPTPIPIKRTPITRYENVYIKKNKEGEPKKDDTDEDIENFGRYVIGLLKKIPKDVCTQLQMDIINMIMTAKLKISTPVVPDTMNVSYSNDTETSRAVIVTTPSNVVHTNHNNESVPSLVIEVNNTKNHNNESLSSLQ